MVTYRNPDARSYKIPYSDGSPDLTSIYRFHANLFEGILTPLVSLDSVAAELGVKHVLVKDESSRFGLPAFKILGASWAISSVLADRWNVDRESLTIERLRDCAKQYPSFTVITATDGNHGRACAKMASVLGIQSRIFIPKGVPDISKNMIAREGGQVVIVDGDYDTAVRVAALISQDLGHDQSVLVQDTAWKGYEDIPLCIVQGYATLFSEIDTQLKELNLPNITHCVVPVGVGSLAHAVVQYYHSQTRPMDVSVVTVEPSAAPCLNTSLHKGERISIQTSTTAMQGLNCGTVSYTAWPDLKAGVEVSVVVEEEEVLVSVNDLGALGIKAGPCGAATLAALRKLKGSGGDLGNDAVIVLLVTEGRVSE